MIFLVFFECAARLAGREMAGLANGGQQQQNGADWQEGVNDNDAIRKISSISRGGVALRRTLDSMRLPLLLIAATSTFRMYFRTVKLRFLIGA
jgi:hypothetical protein